MNDILRFFLRYARPYLPHYGLGLCCLGVTNWIVATVPELVGRALGQLAERGLSAIDSAQALALQVCLLAAGIVVFRTVSRIMFFNPGREIEYRLGVDLFTHLLRLQRVFYERRKVGELLSMVVSDVQAVRLLVGFASLQICNVVIGVPVYLYKMWITDPVMTLWVVGPIGVGVLFMRFAVAHFYRMIKDGQAKVAALAERILECYSGIGSIRAHVADAAALARFDERNDDLLGLQLRVSGLRAFGLPVLANTGFVAMGLVLLIGGQRVIAGEMNIGQLSTFSGLLVLLVAILTSLVWVLVAISRGAVSLGRVNSLFDESPGLPEADEVYPGDRAPRLELDNVCFKYPNPRSEGPQGQGAREGFELKGISAKVAAGGTLGVFGATGSGKTTLLDLIARVYTPPDGSVCLDDIDVNRIELGQLRAASAVVAQDPFLFSARLRDNITMSRLRADADTEPGQASQPPDPQLQSVIEGAALGLDIERLPEGLDTIVGERGVILSGGQRQRASLARALYRQPRLLLLDDVLSAVDQNTEAQLVEAIRNLGQAELATRPTTVIVSHRTSVLEHADEIIVLEAGELRERGTHRELLAAGGNYAKAHAHQSHQEGEA